MRSNKALRFAPIRNAARRAWQCAMNAGLVPDPTRTEAWRRFVRLAFVTAGNDPWRPLAWYEVPRKMRRALWGRA